VCHQLYQVIIGPLNFIIDILFYTVKFMKNFATLQKWYVKIIEFCYQMILMCKDFYSIVPVPVPSPDIMSTSTSVLITALF